MEGGTEENVTKGEAEEAPESVNRPDNISQDEGAPAEVTESQLKEENVAEERVEEETLVEETVEPAAEDGENEGSTDAKSDEREAGGESITTEEEEGEKEELNVSQEEEEGAAEEEEQQEEEAEEEEEEEDEEEEEEEKEKQEEEEVVEEPQAPPIDPKYEEMMMFLQELMERRDEALETSRELQKKLTEYVCRRTKSESSMRKKLPLPDQLQDYEEMVHLRSELKQQHAADVESAKVEVEMQRAEAQIKEEEVDNEWREFLTVKKDAAIAALRRPFGLDVARSKVESVITQEQLQQDDLVKMRLKFFNLTLKVQKLEAALHEEEELGRDCLQVQYERLMAERQEVKRRAEKEKEEAQKVQREINRSTEALAEVKEKLYWSQLEVQGKREELAQVKAAVNARRDVLTNARLNHKKTQRLNTKLRDSLGLLGNRVLLQDFEETLDASNSLLTRVERLKKRRAHLNSLSNRFKMKLNK